MSNRKKTIGLCREAAQHAIAYANSLHEADKKLYMDCIRELCSIQGHVVEGLSRKKVDAF